MVTLGLGGLGFITAASYMWTNDMEFTRMERLVKAMVGGALRDTADILIGVKRILDC